jgi:hypothetical protein
MGDAPAERVLKGAWSGGARRKKGRGEPTEGAWQQRPRFRQRRHPHVGGTGGAALGCRAEKRLEMRWRGGCVGRETGAALEEQRGGGSWGFGSLRPRLVSKSQPTDRAGRGGERVGRRRENRWAIGLVSQLKKERSIYGDMQL